MKLSLASSAIAVSLMGVAQAQMAQFTLDTPANIKKAASQVAWNLLQYYHGNETGQTPGILPGPPASGLGPYYWWQGGAMWGAFIDYWYYTGDTTYNDLVKSSILFQTGENNDFMPRNYTASMGNDDQGFWGMTAMTAAETVFSNPAADQPQWLALAQAVFNSMATPDRWQSNICGGGLRWQVPFSNKGYDYKNTIANGCFFNIGARLARYTDNSTYAEWAEKTWDWMEGVGFMGTDNEALYDGAHVETNCTDINKEQYSYNNAVFLQGAAFMYNYTDGDTKWKSRLDKMLEHGFKVFFPEGICYEPWCEASGSCTTDMLSFKGYVHRWYSSAAKLAPYIEDQVKPVLTKSAQAAAKVCTGGSTNQCGFSWSKGTFDDSLGAGQEMSALGAFSALLLDDVAAPATAKKGGTSKGDPNAGSEANSFLDDQDRITTGDRAGAGILTFLILGSAIGMYGWMSFGGDA
ncbi:mannan endo-1,6-alpha-mannosidase [Geosmithia morbida]|uniref:Mannan endo-1,6-alpha-mannosidase n=1 Tax=Geosmithia morbida TaxID=1094350 RepID=A0A9P5CZ58_9HYPO|nr:mannan endo-1,6-alpha-mannosidase [Geosmithia morbida]KAF4120092.1 mannan endo-1,6-alpha-mannosidase [Geosmithia morbida]